MCWYRNGRYPGRKISLRDLPLRKPAFVLRQRFLCLRRWMRSWHPCYSRTVSTEQTATTWGLLLVYKPPAEWCSLSMRQCTHVCLCYMALFHRIRQYATLRWARHIDILVFEVASLSWFGILMVNDLKDSNWLYIHPEAICNVFRLHPTISIHVADLNRHIVVIYMLQRSMWFIFRNILIFFIKRFRYFMPIIIPCKCARQPKHSLFCKPIWW